MELLLFQSQMIPLRIILLSAETVCLVFSKKY